MVVIGVLGPEGSFFLVLCSLFALDVPMKSSISLEIMESVLILLLCSSLSFDFDDSDSLRCGLLGRISATAVSSSLVGEA